jgi:hypothetical protein
MYDIAQITVVHATCRIQYFGSLDVSVRQPKSCIEWIGAFAQIHTRPKILPRRKLVCRVEYESFIQPENKLKRVRAKAKLPLQSDKFKPNNRLNSGLHLVKVAKGAVTRRNQLAVAPVALNELALRVLIKDWVVPALVSQYLASQTTCIADDVDGVVGGGA